MKKVIKTILSLASVALAQESCFVESPQSYGGTAGKMDTDKTRFDNMDTITPAHRISGINYCFKLESDGSMGPLLALQTELHAFQNLIWQEPKFLLNVHGSVEETNRRCLKWDIPPGDKLKQMQVSYSSTRVNQVVFTTDLGYMIAGNPGNSDTIAKVDFDYSKQIPLGFYGLEQTELYLFSIGLVYHEQACIEANSPTSPQSLTAGLTTASQIALSWQAPIEGPSYDTYQIMTDLGTNGVDFSILVKGLTPSTLSYTATGMVQGTTYQFKVRANNKYGFGSYSNIVTVLAAQEPAKPAAPMTAWSPDNLVVTWVRPNNGGSALTGYTVKIR